ncbi:MAG: magnetosome biogenesis CDF transporter MamM [Gammaproteobacteria bacterium]|nr:magnetosome biogenesis CDF transporter MamM [Gammaproteobacteria bacterium]MBT4605984.1 magnetosome biogenesis CDF transporter MamM [Thiotrichales bacterium]MBT3473883.1 magnetosome biogenesis CDF transporter MamM [Gammaproteobacteria bacterium]MBT3967993.1 magnetosome biogenesis CDF transporter MamM [Gammaproteobacteria bacterium]MBT4079390.1 magnetosome biogenesis CDF transporter MamM [Gammaproteobacteria bacterium]
MRYSKCISCASYIGWIGLGTNLVLMILKGFVGFVSGSQALVADAMYSAKDVITSLLVIVGLKVSGRPLDREHPYGHGKIEFILSMIISVVFLGVTSLLLIHAIQVLMDDNVHSSPHIIALWTAIISILVNVVMYFYSRCVSIEVNSPMVRTLSRHHHADATSSVAVALGIIGAHYLNMPWIDTAVAVFETAHLMYLGSDVFREAYKGLMDGSAPEEVKQEISHQALKVAGVEAVEELKTRLVGQDLWVDMVIRVDAELTVDEASDICEDVSDRLVRVVPHMGSVHVKFTGEAVEQDDSDDLDDYSPVTL